MKSVGGYFEVVVGGGTQSTPHPDTELLHSGRSCLTALLRAARAERVFVPDFICDSVLESAHLAGAEIMYFGLKSDLSPELDPVQTKPTDVVLLVNYFGLCGDQVDQAAERLDCTAIVDNTQAFFRTSDRCYFNSARKFFGVPDGAFCRSPVPLTIAADRAAASSDHLFLLALGNRDEGFVAYREAESAISAEPLRPSLLGEYLLTRVEYDAAAKRRRENFLVLSTLLGSLNSLAFTLGDQVPYCYPYLPVQPTNRSKLLASGVFFPQLWPEVLRRPGRSDSTARLLARDLLPLPIDQRFGPADMAWVADRVLALTGHG